MHCTSCLLRLITRFLKADSGVTAIEYSLLGSLVALAIIVGAGLLGNQLDIVYNTLAAAFPGA